MTRSQLNCSYFFDYETKYNWGNFTYFTFFSEFNRPWPYFAYIEATVMIVLFLMSLFGNIFIIAFLIKSKKSRTITNYLVSNLAIADIFFVTSAPCVAYIRLSTTWRLGDVTCSFLIYSMFVCAIVMTWTMAVISKDRYTCMNLSFSSRKRMKPCHVLITTALIWIASALFYLPVALYFHVKSIDTLKGNVSFCTVIWPKSDVKISLLFTCSVVIAAFAIPLVIITVNYFRIFKKLWISKRTVANATRTTVSRSSRSSAARQRRNVRIVKTLTLLVLVFLVMWLPLFLTFGLIQYDVTYTNNALPSCVLVWTLIIAYCNACVNPFMYGFINSELQRGLTRCCKNHQTDDLLDSHTINEEHHHHELSDHSNSVHM